MHVSVHQNQKIAELKPQPFSVTHSFETGMYSHVVSHNATDGVKTPFVFNSNMFIIYLKRTMLPCLMEIGCYIFT